MKNQRSSLVGLGRRSFPDLDFYDDDPSAKGAMEDANPGIGIASGDHVAEQDVLPPPPGGTGPSSPQAGAYAPGSLPVPVGASSVRPGPFGYNAAASSPPRSIAPMPTKPTSPLWLWAVLLLLLLFSVGAIAVGGVTGLLLALDDWQPHGVDSGDEIGMGDFHFRPPSGWKRSSEPDERFDAPDRKAALVYTTLASEAEADRNLARILRKLHVVDVAWNASSTKVSIGSDSIEGRANQGRGKIGETTVVVQRLVVSASSTSWMLITCVTTQHAPEAHRDEASDSIQSLHYAR